MATSPVDDTADHVTADEDSSTVAVHNIKDLTNLELELVFENRNRSDGGDVSRIEINRDLNIAYVTFKDKSVKKRVLARGQVKYNNQMLTIKPAPKHDPHSILVTGLAPRTTKEMLEMYFENSKRSGGGPVEEIIYEEGRQWARVVFKSKEVRDRVLDHPQKLFGQDIKVMPHVISSMVQVYPVNGLSLEVLELYLDSPRHSGGGGVVSCRIQQGVALVEFQEPEAVKRVVAQKHTIEGHELQVDVYHPELGVTHTIPSLEYDPPASFSLPLPHPAIEQFLSYSPEISTLLREAMESLKFSLSFADGSVNVNYVKYGLDIRTSEVWKQEVSSKLTEIFSKIHVISLPVTEDCQETLLQKCEQLSSNEVLLNYDGISGTLVIVGLKEAVEDMEKKVKQFIRQLSVIENKITLPKWQIQLMELTNHISYMKERVPGLDVCINNMEVILHGEPNHIQLAFSLLYDDFANSCVQHEFEMCGTVFGALQNMRLFDRVCEKLQSHNILAALEVNNNSHLVIVHALSDADAERCGGLIVQCLVSRSFQVPTQHKSFFQSSVWSNLKQQLLEVDPDAVVILANPETCTLEIICWHDHVVAVDEKLQAMKFLLSEERLVPLSTPVICLFTLHYPHHIKAITDNINQVFSDGNATTIELCDPDEIEGYIVRGPVDNLDIAVSELHRLASEVVPQDIAITQQPAAKYFLSVSGQAFLEDITNVHRMVYVTNENTDVLLKRLKEHLSSSDPGSQAAPVPFCHVIRLKNDVEVKIHNNNLQNSDIELIIVPADRKLNHTLAGVKHLMDLAGDAVKSSNQQHIVSNSNLALGSVWETEAGHLTCKKLLHIITDDGDLISCDHLIIEQAVLSCMEHVKQNHVKSVAFMVLETGPEQRSPLMAKGQAIATALVMSLLGSKPTVRHIELVGSNWLLCQVMKDVLLSICEELGVQIDAIEGDTGENQVTAMATGRDDEVSDDGADSLNIRLYGLDNRDLETVARAIQGKSDEVISKMVMQFTQSMINEDDSEAEQSDTSMGATGGATSSEDKGQFYWEYQRNGDVFEAFPKDISDMLEISYTEDMNTEVEYIDDAGRQHVVDFKNMVKCSPDNPAQVDLVRRVPGTIPLYHAALPSNWDPMKPGERLKMVELDSDSEEYKQVQNDFLVSSRCQINIVKIERVQNPFLYQQYRTKKQQMDKLNDLRTINQYKLYHGTDIASIRNINMNGFNRSYCGRNGTSYGRGVYFAKNASYSLGRAYSPPDLNGNRYIYQCLVLVGEFAQGNPGYVEPPEKNRDNPAIRYDSVVDNPNNPSVFVIFSDMQAYPEYLITFMG